jgi:hypothetical protein
VAPEIALAYAVIAHLTFFVPITVWGALAVLYYGAQVGDAAALARQARAPSAIREVQGVKLQVIASGESVQAPTAVSPFLCKLVEAIVSVPGEPPADKHIVDAAAQFTSEELGSLERRLRVAFALGMMTFRIYTCLRFFRSFESLDLERRQAAVNAWAYGRVQLFRQLFRPVRSLCLLAFHELLAEGTRGQKVPLRLVAHG